MSNGPRSVGRRTFVGTAGAVAAALAGCSGAGPTGGTMGGGDTDDTAETARTDGATRSRGERTATGYTYQRPSGNRRVAGEGPFPDADATDVTLNWTPAWVVGVPAVDGEAGDGGSRWAIVGEHGEVASVEVRDGTVSSAEVVPDDLPAGLPPLLRGSRPPAVVTPPEGATDPADATHPVPVSEGLLYVSTDGDLVLWDGGEVDRLALDALPDVRIVTAEGRAFVFAGATTRYDHGVLGDGVEAGSVAVVDYRGGLSETTRIWPTPDGEAVFEGVAPIVADLTGDGERDVVATESDAESGARVVAFDASGERMATGPPIGHGYGWRHQIAVAPFGPDGTPELAAVRTPHVGRTAEFYRRDGNDLRIVGEAQGYSSHAMGSRNLDAGLAGDVDADGRVELLVPTGDRDALGGIRRTRDGATGVWTVGLGGTLTTNLGAVNSGGRVTVAAGWDGTVRFWSG